MNLKKSIAFDIMPLVTQLKKFRGIGQSTLRLAKNLLEFSTHYNVIFYAPDGENLAKYLPGADIRYVSNKKDLPKRLISDGMNLVHFNDYFFPLFDPVQFAQGEYRLLYTVISVYDLIPFYFKDKKSSAQRIYKNLFPLLQKVDGIRANSIDTKNELLRKTGLDSSKIRVIYHGIDHQQFHNNYAAEQIAKIKSIYEIENEYILQVGAMDWRKNPLTTLKAYHELLKQGNLNLDLVFAGDPNRNECLSYIKENKLEKRVKCLGLIPDDHLPLIYNGALLFAFPSLYEGFGNPPLEAMACGLPVISSDRGSLPEILGNAASYVEPNNIQGWSKKISELYHSPDSRKQMRKKGLLQAGKFRWENTVADLLNFYNDIFNKRAQPYHRLF